MDLLNNIAIAIDKSGKTRAEIACELGITYNHLWRLLSGKCKMKAEMIANIAIIIKKTPNELYGPLSNFAGSENLLNPSAQNAKKGQYARISPGQK
jgi:transcriptional regulator with XRE-family HTH domain